jgi:hypothetical protein
MDSESTWHVEGRKWNKNTQLLLSRDFQTETLTSSILISKLETTNTTQLAKERLQAR